MKSKTVMDQMNAEKPDDVLADLEAKHGRSPAPCSAFLPCPFCGGDAESDTMQSFRRMSDGRMSLAVAIYCSKCTAQVSMCHEDHKEYAPEDLMTILTDAWNQRVPNEKLTNPAAE